MGETVVKNHSHRRNTQGGNGGEGLEQMAEHVDDGDVDDRLELPEQQVRQHGAEYRGEVAEHREGVVDHLQKQTKLPNTQKTEKR